jgi:hypothetical protein
MLLAVLAFAASAYLSVEHNHAAAEKPLVLVDWQDPEMLPRQFRNHCRFDPASSRYYCSNHCGSNYQFYYCSRQSFGCCLVGRGYCDGDAQLRCVPWDRLPFPELRNLPSGGGPPIESQMKSLWKSGPRR